MECGCKEAADRVTGPAAALTLATSTSPGLVIAGPGLPECRPGRGVRRGRRHAPAISTPPSQVTHPGSNLAGFSGTTGRSRSGRADTPAVGERGQMGTVIATRSEMPGRRSRAATARRGRRRFLDRRQRPGIGLHAPRQPHHHAALNRGKAEEKPGGWHASNTCQNVPAMRAPLLQHPPPRVACPRGSPPARTPARAGRRQPSRDQRLGREGRRQLNHQGR